MLKDSKKSVHDIVVHPGSAGSVGSTGTKRSTSQWDIEIRRAMLKFAGVTPRYHRHERQEYVYGHGDCLSQAAHPDAGEC